MNKIMYRVDIFILFTTLFMRGSAVSQEKEQPAAEVK